MSEPFILVSAHHCAPGMGSEHAVGWNLVSRLAKSHNLILITEDNAFRSAVEDGISDLRASGCRIEVFFVYHGSVSDGRKNNLRIGYYLTYRAYQRRVLAVARELQKQYKIVAVHHLTIVGFREPGFLWQLGVPFIWGPVGGLVFAPRELFSLLSIRMRIFMAIRNQVTRWQFCFSPRVRKAYHATQRSGGAFVAATRDIGDRFIARFGGEVQWVPETGSKPPVQAKRTRRTEGPLRILWVGGILDIKPLGLLLDAISDVPEHEHRISLKVIGDGDARMRQEAKARAQNIKAEFSGWLPHREALAAFDGADLFILLSIKDLTTNVVFESLACALPVLCLNHHGYSEIVDSSCGIKLPITSPLALRAELAAILDRLATDATPLALLSEGARKRAEMFTWDRNAQELSQLYDRAVSAGDQKTFQY